MKLHNYLAIFILISSLGCVSESSPIIRGDTLSTGQYVYITDGASIAQVDDISNTLQTIEYEHHEIHEGNHYFIKTWLESDNAANTFQNFTFVTPDSSVAAIHAKAIFQFDADFTVSIWEDCVVEENGTSITAYNNYRDSVNNAKIIAYANPTIIDSGTIIWTARTGGSKQPIGIANTIDYEIIAKENTQYCFSIEHNVVGTHYADINFFWYENNH